LESSLLEGGDALYQVLRKEAVEGVLHEHFQGRRNHAFKIWGLLILSHWLRQFSVGAK